MSKNLIQETINGTIDSSFEEFYIALNKAVKQMCKNTFATESGQYLYTYISSVTGEKSSGECMFLCGIENPDYSYNEKYYAVGFQSKSDNTGYDITFNGLFESKKSLTYSKVGEEIPITTNEYKIATESVASEEKQVTEIFESCEFLLEGTKEENLSKLEKNGFIEGKIRAVKINALSANKNRYTESFVESLDKKINAYLSKKETPTDEKSFNSPWPNLAMFASHAPAMGQEDTSRFFGVVGKITGTYVENGYWGIKYATLKSANGQHMAELIIEGMVDAISLRAHIKNAIENKDGGFDALEAYFKGFGVDFTYSPAMPGIKEKGITIESIENSKEKKAMNLKTLEDVKEHFPELYESIKAKIDAGESADSVIADLNKKLTLLTKENESLALESKISKATPVVTAVVSIFENKLSDETSLKEATVKSILESMKSEADAIAKNLINTRPELDVNSVSFRDIVESTLTPKFNKTLESTKALIAEYLSDSTFTAKPNLSNAEAAPEGVAGMKNINLNTMDPRFRLIESENEMVGLPTTFESARDSEPNAPSESDVMIAAAFNIPVYETDRNTGNRVHVMDKFFPSQRNLARETCRIYKDVPTIFREGMMNFSDSHFIGAESYNKTIAKLKARVSLEAGELTSSGVLGTLYPDFRDGVIQAAYAMAVWLQMVSTRSVQSDKYRSFTETYRHYTDWSYGTVAKSSGSWAAYSVGSGAIPTYNRAFIKMTSSTTTTVTTTFTVTYTNQNGTTGRTTTVVVPIGTTTGTYIEIRPGINGERFSNITGATASNSDGSNGDTFAFVTDQPASTGSELTVSGKASLITTPTEYSIDELDLEFTTSWRAIEDAMISWANVGPGRYELIGAMLRNISSDMADIVDRRGFNAANSSSNLDSSNSATFDTTAVPPSLSSYEYLSTLHDQLVALSERIEDWSNFQPNRLAINRADKHKMLWMKGDFITRFEDRANAFFRALAWGNVAGFDVYVAANQPHNRFLAMNSDNVQHIQYIPMQLRGPYSYLGSQKVDTYVLRQRSSDDFVRPRTRGTLTILQ